MKSSEGYGRANLGRPREKLKTKKSPLGKRRREENNCTGGLPSGGVRLGTVV